MKTIVRCISLAAILSILIFTKNAASQYDTLFYEDFDQGAPGWICQDLWSESYWHISTTGAYSGQSYWCGIEELGGYDDNWAQTLTSPSISLEGAVMPMLTFKHNYWGEENFSWLFNDYDLFDAFTVRLSTDGEHFEVIEPSQGPPYTGQNAYGFYYRFGDDLAGWAGNSTGWKTSGFDLSAYAGQTIWFQFLLGSDYGFSSKDESDFFGWRIDDIKVVDNNVVIFSDDAGDTGETGMVPGGPGGCDLWHLQTDESVSPPSAMAFFDPYSGKYQARANNALVTPPIPLEDLPDRILKLIADFKIKGVIDQYLFRTYLSDVLCIEARAFDNGVWGYWTNEYFAPWIPETFHDFGAYEFFPMEVTNLKTADSLQLRIRVVTGPDDIVMGPAKIFIDDFVLYTQTGYCGNIFGRFYDRISTAPLLQRQAIADSFLATLPSCPIVEENQYATFLYLGHAKKVTIPGLETWDTTFCPMERIVGTDLWFYQALLEPDSRVEYKFVIDGVTWLQDPLNPDHTGYEYDNSQLVMPEYLPPEEIEYQAGIPHGTVFDTNFYSGILDNTRKVWIYMPPGYADETDKYYPVILFHDGASYYIDAMATNVLDNLIAEGRICPVIAVFVPPVQREQEYAFDLTQQFESFIVDELMPYIDADYRIRTEPGCRAMAGSSFGGLISTQICYDRPGDFGLCAAYSPAYILYEGSVFYNFIDGPSEAIKFYIDWGTHEHDILQVSIIFKNNLYYKGYEYISNEWHEGHNVGNWRAHLDNMLEYFFPVSMGYEHYNMQVKTGVQCYPNPFSLKTRIEYDIEQPGPVKVMVYNHLGENVGLLVNEYQERGKHFLDWEAGNLASGIYYIRIITERSVKSSEGKVILIRN